MIESFTVSPESGSPLFLNTLARIVAETGPGRAVRRGLENSLAILVDKLGYRRVCLELHDLPKPNARIYLSHGREKGLDHLFGPGPLSTGQVMAFQIYCNGKPTEAFRDCLYYSVSLFTNTGCADCAPAPSLRLLAASEAFFGYLTLGVACACLIVILVRLIAADKLPR